MTDTAGKTARDYIVETAEAFFDRPVEDVTAPGGESRASFRLRIGGRSLIATLRPNFRRTHLEAHVLRELGEHCDDLPVCLGVSGEVMFQSDVGSRRLNTLIATLDAPRQLDLAAEAVAALFRIHAAARKTKLHEIMPHLGATESWVETFIGGIDQLQELTGGISDAFDRNAACAAVAITGYQFVKWDCRSGNAAIDDDDRLRWFDFEYAGMRHGAEDFAWLIGDEAWPIAPDRMVDVLIDAFDPSCGIPLDDYMHYLAIYMTFHATQRMNLVAREAKKRGWASKHHIRKYDDAGRNPAFAVHIAEVGAYFSDQTTLTAPLTRNFLAARDGFAGILAERLEKRSA
ncbi:hypothetical protein FIU94_00455 [Sulfitobacter sp. THAF37]|uniref:aminoglycoside phosphotransferase family protein n=1 Tax=Sulfitobacter sp. THAF37 TaxID=2587855 RepID=UPI0012AA5C3A|nr:aminoglycoside phosphotransferase family protein [Sulfitobacter sp. THAF37]QFT57278.1 hypothetical protein FIU94_00455 [Sulfitobacter sp. THAF37]